MEIYLDHAATTPLDPEVFAAMEPFLRQEFGNPSSIHASGMRARMAVDEARERIASCLGAQPTEIVFTSGGTESDNAAILGHVAHVGRDMGVAHVVASSIEHEAILESCSEVRRDGHQVTLISPGADGVVKLDDVRAASERGATLVSIMHANNEIGTIQPVAAIGAYCREKGIVFHSDVVQTAGVLPLNIDDLNLDLASLSAHKFYGPKGVGVLYIRSGTPWRARQHGGGQERQRRSGTENVAGIVGMAAAFERAVEIQHETAQRLLAMRTFLLDALSAIDVEPRPIVNGSIGSRLPGNVNVSFPGISGESLVMALDQEGVRVSSGSACSSGSTEPSHVLLAIGSTPEAAHGALRITMGRENTWEELRVAVDVMASTIQRLAGAGRQSRQSA